MVLIEMIIAIFFFAVSQAVLLQVFATAQKDNHDSVVLNHALICAEDAAETLGASDDAEQALLSLGFVHQENAYVYASDEGFTVSASILCTEQSAGTLVEVMLTAMQSGNELFTLPAAVYTGVSAP